MLTRPHAAAVLASIGSPVTSISSAHFRPMERVSGDHRRRAEPSPLPPGVAKAAFSDATARSQEATSWQPAAVASPCTFATTGCGIDWITVISSVQRRQKRPHGTQAPSQNVGEVVTGAKEGPAPARMTPLGVAAPPSGSLDQLFHVILRERIAPLRAVHHYRGEIAVFQKLHIPTRHGQFSLL